MEKQACRGLEDRLAPLTYNLAEAVHTPGLCKRPPKSKVRPREASSSDNSSAEKPLRKNLKMTGNVKGQAAAINAMTASSGENDDSDIQSTHPPGHKPVDTGKKGEQYCREFLKMNPVKKGLRDDKDERKHRNTTACHYDAIADERFVGTVLTENSLLPKMEPIEMVGIIMAHYRYKEHFIEAIIKDVEPFCLNKTDTLGLDKAHMEEAQKVEEIFPKVVDLFFNDPTDKIKTIVTFKNNKVCEKHLGDHESMIPALKQIINILLRNSKLNTKKNKDWR